MPSNCTWISTSSTDWNTAANWSSGTVPVSGDTVVFANNSVNVDTNLNQSAVTLAALYIYQSYTGAIGKSDGTYLAIGATAVRIGDPGNSPTTPNGSGRLLLNFGTVQTTVVVVNTSQTSTDTAFAPLLMKGTHASNKLVVYSGRVESATRFAGDVSTWSEVDVQAGGASAPTVLLGTGCTLTTINQNAGTLTVNSAATTVTLSSGTLTTQGSGAITTLTVGGIAKLNSTGTITTLNALGGGTADFSGDAQAKTVTTLKAYKGTKINLDNGVKGSVTMTNPIALQNCRLNDITLTSWLNNTLALA